LAGRLPEEPRLLDLGAGTGSLFRFAAPIIARPQSWIFADADSFLLGRGLERTVEWARGRGFAARRADGSTGPALTLNAPSGPWRIETLVTDLAQAPRGLPLSLVDAVVCSALLDLTSRAWMERLFGGLALPFYAGMNVDGQDAWLPRHPADLAVRTAFRGDQRRDKGLGPALGNLAVDTAMQLLGSGGFETCVARSDWQISRGDAALAGTLVEMTAQPARRAMPAQAAKFTRWATARSRQAQASRLSIRIGHRDLLAFPPKG
jgi:hypothetical protein